jgi:hypothetical protein
MKSNTQFVRTDKGECSQISENQHCENQFNFFLMLIPLPGVEFFFGGGGGGELYLTGIILCENQTQWGIIKI